MQPPPVTKAPSPAPTPAPVPPVSTPTPTPVAPPAVKQSAQPQPATPTPVPPPAQNTTPADTKPVIKGEPITPSSPHQTTLGSMEIDTNGEEGGGGGSTTSKPHWPTRRWPTCKYYFLYYHER